MIRIRLPNGVPLGWDVGMAFVWGWAVMLVAAGFALRSSLPSRFFYDSETILSLMQSRARVAFGSDSFTNVAAIYQWLGIDSQNVTVIGALLVATSLLVAWSAGSAARIGIMQLLFGLAWSLIMMVYLAPLSKDLLVLVLAILFIAAAGNGALILWFLVSALFALYIRSYWFLVLGLSAFAMVMQLRIRSVIGWLLLTLASYGALAVMFYFVLGEPLTYPRDLVNAVRLDSSVAEAETMITNLLPGEGPFIGWVNTVVGLGSLFVPIPLMLHGQPQHIASALATICTFGIALWSVRVLVSRDAYDRRCRGIVALLWGFLLTQGLFEPDYGSFLRHFAPLAPLVVFLCARATAALAPRAISACA
jgi:hypothetical protein